LSFQVQDPAHQLKRFLILQDRFTLDQMLMYTYTLQLMVN